MTDLTAFCERVQERLENASFADRQALLHLVIDVHDDSLKIRHVIPPAQSAAGAGGYLRSEWSIVFGSCAPGTAAKWRSGPV
jgi:hypothetical protein